jgi:type IV secretory pathway VirJ component
MTNKIILISGMILTVCLSGCKGEDNSSEQNHSDSAVVTTSVTNAEAATSSVITTTALAAEGTTVPQTTTTPAVSETTSAPEETETIDEKVTEVTDSENIVTAVPEPEDNNGLPDNLNLDENEWA